MKTYDATECIYLHELIEAEKPEVEYTGKTVLGVINEYYSDLYETLERYDMEEEFNFEDWLNAKTHFQFCNGLWESYTLDLLCNDGGPTEVGR